MLKEVGARFKFEGADQAIRKTDRLKGSFSSLKTSVKSSLSPLNKTVSVMGAMKVGAVALVGAMASVAAGVYGMKKAFEFINEGRYAISKQSTELIPLGANLQDLKQFETEAIKIQQNVAGALSENIVTSMYDIKSAISTLTNTQIGQVTRVATVLAQTTKMQAEQSTAMMGGIFGATYASVEGKYSPLEYAQKVAGVVHKAVQLNKTTGPQLQSGLKNAMPSLVAAGWEIDQMVAALATLNTAGLSGEQAGEAMKSLATKSREGAFRMFLEANNITQRFEKLSKTEQAKYERNIGGQFQSMFSKDPTKYISKVGGLIEKLKAQGKDYMGLLTKSFGETGAKALLLMVQQQQKFNENISELKNADYDKTLEMFKNKQMTWSSMIDLTSQAYKSLKETISTTLARYVQPQMARLHHALNVATTLWRALFYSGDAKGQALKDLKQLAGGTERYRVEYLIPLQKILGHLKHMANGFWSAMAGSGAAQQSMNIFKQLQLHLREMGQAKLHEIGKGLGLGLKEIKEWAKQLSAKGTMASIKGFISAMQSLANAISTVVSAYRQLKEAWGFLSNDVESYWNQQQLSNKTGLQASRELMGEDYTPAFSAKPSQMQDIAPPKPQAPPTSNVTPPTPVNIKEGDIKVDIYMDGQKINESVIRRVQAERDRYRASSGSTMPQYAR